MAAGHSVVVVDDEEDLREPIAAYLREQGVDVREADGGASLDALIADRIPRLVVLDVSMPHEDGFSIARRLRAAHPQMGIVMLTARRDVIDRVVGLELGADDYIMKPFEPRELLARLRSVLRRIDASPASSPAPVQTHVAASAPANPESYQDSFWIPTSRGQINLPVASIDWIEAAKDYALFHTAERSHMIRVTMAALERAIDPAELMRVHRSAFVRPRIVQKIALVGRHMTLVLRSGASVRVGPQYWTGVRERLALRTPARHRAADDVGDEE